MQWDKFASQLKQKDDKYTWYMCQKDNAISHYKQCHNISKVVDIFTFGISHLICKKRALKQLQICNKSIEAATKTPIVQIKQIMYLQAVQHNNQTDYKYQYISILNSLKNKQEALHVYKVLHNEIHNERENNINYQQNLNDMSKCSQEARNTLKEVLDELIKFINT